MTKPPRSSFPKTTRGFYLGLIGALGLQSVMPDGAAAGFVDLTRPPAVVEVVLADRTLLLPSSSDAVWSAGGVEVRVQKVGSTASEVSLAAEGVPVRKVHLHWAATFGAETLFLGDTWERAYADLQWSPLPKTGPMPWYFLAAAGSSTDGYGVMTGPAAFCYWRVDGEGIDLWADVRSGSSGVELGNRRLAVCTITDRQGRIGENAFGAAQAFCKQMCPHPRPAPAPVYGFNDWNCDYGADTAARFLANAAYIASLAPSGSNRPWMVIDDGWQTNRQDGKERGNPWMGTNAKFGSTMPAVATDRKSVV